MSWEGLLSIYSESFHNAARTEVVHLPADTDTTKALSARAEMTDEVFFFSNINKYLKIIYIG